MDHVSDIKEVRVKDEQLERKTILGYLEKYIISGLVSYKSNFL